MKLLQSIYTSCKVGQTGNSGFQFYSYSDGFIEDELRELERLGNYIAPYNLPTVPTPEEIKTFPISFSYFRLASGRVGVIQSTPLTEEYSGRPGNFLAHALVVEDGDAFPFLPILLYRSPSLRQNLTTEEWNVSTVPEKLPLISVEQLVLNKDFTVENVVKFLGDNNDYDNYFPQVVDAIIKNGLTGRRIILSDTMDNIVHWILAISYAFPEKLVKKITFSTYSIDPEQNNFVVAATTAEGSRFDFSNDSAFRFQSYVFNFPEHKFSEIENPTLYADAACMAVATSYERFEAFAKFLNNFSYNEINDEIDVAYNLFISDSRKIAYNGAYQSLFPFLLRYADKANIVGFLKSNGTLLDNFVEKLVSEHQEPSEYFKNISECVIKTRSREALQVLHSSYVSWIYEYVFSPEREKVNEEAISQFLTLNESAISSFAPFKTEFGNLFFSDNVFNAFKDAIKESGNCDIAVYILAIACQNFGPFNKSIESILALDGVQQIKNLIVQQPKVQVLLEMFFNTLSNKDYFIPFLNFFSDKISYENLKSVVAKSSLTTNAIYNQVKQTGNDNLLVLLMPELLEKSNERSEFFWQMNAYFAHRKLSSAQYDYLIGAYINCCKKLRLDELRQLIELAITNNCEQQSQKLVETLAGYINLVKPDVKDYKVLQLIRKYVDENQDTFFNYSCDLCLTLLDIKQNKYANISEIFASLGYDWEILSDDQYKGFIKSLYSACLPYIKTPEDFTPIFTFAFNGRYSDSPVILQKVMRHYFAHQQDLKQLEMLIKFSMNIDAFKVGERKEIIDITVVSLAGTGKSGITKLDEVFSNSKNGAKWKPIREQALEEWDNSLSGRVSNFFSKIFKRS